MYSGIRTAKIAGLALILMFPLAGAWSQGQKSVEESYLQESLETMVISEQAHAEGKDMKTVALQYAKQAIDAGRKNEDIRKSLEYLALEGTNVVIRSAGTGRVLNDFPDVRAKSCDYLGDFPSQAAKDALLKVTLSDREPMVLSAAIRSLGRIGINDNDEVVQIIAYIVNRFDILYPDNSLAFEALVAIERLAEKNGGIRDPGVIRAVMKISTGNYISPVKARATVLLDKLRKYNAVSPNSGAATSSGSSPGTGTGNK
ncbi:MAG: HEAT repeat domain-containing protein [Rectinemataceae bacterium]